MPLLFFAVFILVPIAEIAIIVQVGHLIGWGLTVGLLLLSAVIGTTLLRREGRRAWHAFTGALASGRPPAKEVADGGLVLLGSALMITPGFLTDTLGVLCLLPPTRALLRRLAMSAATRRILARVGLRRLRPRRVRSRRGPGRPYESKFPRRGGAGPVIEGEIRR